MRWPPSSRRRLRSTRCLPGSRRSATTTSATRRTRSPGPCRHPRALRRAAQAHHRHGLQRGRARRVALPISAPRPARHAPPGLGARRRALVLSEEGDHPMTRLSDTQLVILSAAAQRDDGAVLPLPETLKLKGGALDKVLGSLTDRGPDRCDPDAARRRPAAASDHPRRPRGHRRRDRGRRARGRDAPRRRARRQPMPQSRRSRSPGAAADGPATPAKGKKASARRGPAEQAAPADKPTPRAGTKQAR